MFYAILIGLVITLFVFLFIFIKQHFNNSKTKQFRKATKDGAQFLYDEVNKTGSKKLFKNTYSSIKRKIQITKKKSKRISLENAKANQKAGWVIKFDKQKNFFIGSEVHAKILGGTGAGKTQKFILPSLFYNITIPNLNNKPNLVIIDPKGEIELATSAILEENNYQKIVFDLSNPLISTGYNFLRIVWDKFFDTSLDTFEAEAEALAMLRDIIESLFGWVEANGDKYWTDKAKDALYVIGKFFLMFAKSDPSFKKEHFNFASFNDFLATETFAEGPWIEILKNTQNQELAMFYQSEVTPISQTTATTLSGFLSSAQKSIAPFVDLANRSFTSRHEIDIKNELKNSNAINSKPFAIFIKFPDHKKAQHTFVSILFDQIYQLAIDLANVSPNQKLMRPLLFFADEFGNLPKIKDFANKVTIARSRNVFFSIVLQDLEQLNIYNLDKKTIINNMGLTLVFSVSDNQTAKEISESLGKAKVITKSYSNSEKNKSNSESLGSEELMTIDQIKAMDNDQMLLLHNNHKPCRLKTLFAYEVWQINKNILDNKPKIPFNIFDYWFDFKKLNSDLDEQTIEDALEDQQEDYQEHQQVLFDQDYLSLNDNESLSPINSNNSPSIESSPINSNATNDKYQQLNDELQQIKAQIAHFQPNQNPQLLKDLISKSKELKRQLLNLKN